MRTNWGDGLRKLLNTLYITSPDSYLSRDGESVVVRMEEKEALRIPIHNLESVVTFGYTGASPSFMHLCMERGVSISFMRENGQYLGSVYGKVKGNVLLRRKQYRIADDEAKAALIAGRMIAAKSQILALY
jgi:CRISPR-associated protein Cas1